MIRTATPPSDRRELLESSGERSWAIRVTPRHRLGHARAAPNNALVPLRQCQVTVGQGSRFACTSLLDFQRAVVRRGLSDPRAADRGGASKRSHPDEWICFESLARTPRSISLVDTGGTAGRPFARLKARAAAATAERSLSAWRPGLDGRLAATGRSERQIQSALRRVLGLTDVDLVSPTDLADRVAEVASSLALCSLAGRILSSSRPAGPVGVRRGRSSPVRPPPRLDRAPRPGPQPFVSLPFGLPDPQDKVARLSAGPPPSRGRIEVRTADLARAVAADLATDGTPAPPRLAAVVLSNLPVYSITPG